MAEALKHLYGREYIELLSAEISKVYPDFPAAKFNSLVFDKTWPRRELKQRMRHITECLGKTLPENYSSALDILMKARPRMTGPKYVGFANICLADFVEVYGLDHYAASIPALEVFTVESSSEFAVRPFIVKYPDLMMKQMLTWAHHPHEHVRRLASEGCRPRLPWAMGLPEFKKDPSPVLPILDALKNDPSEFVRRSVANNLNDIAKDHPDLVLKIAARWKGHSPETDRLIKHACRTLLKKGNTKALEYFGLRKPKGVKIHELKLNAASIKIGGKLSLTFSVYTPKTQKLRIEYTIGFLTGSGKVSTKIFKIAEKKLIGRNSHIFTRSHSFRDRTIRKHTAGNHTLAIVVNGHILTKKEFNLRPQK